EPRLRGRSRQPAAGSDRDACLAVRRVQLRAGAEGQAGILGAIPSRGFARPARQSLSVRALRRPDARPQELKTLSPPCGGSLEQSTHLLPGLRQSEWSGVYRLFSPSKEIERCSGCVPTGTLYIGRAGT